MYDFVNITAANNTIELINAINMDWTGGVFGILILVVAGIVIFINLSFYGTKEAFLFASFYASIMAGLAWLSGLVGIYIFVISVVILFVTVLLAILIGDK